MTPVADPTMRVERKMFASGARYVIGLDEVGRGAIAGPVAVGAALIAPTRRRIPAGLRDSKMLSEKRREELAPLAASWSLHSAVGLATCDEVDAIGLTACLGLAARRALEALAELGAPVSEAVVLLDGNWDYVNRALPAPVPVQTRIKADRDCASVAAASVIAKVHRDRLMIDRHAVEPRYGWAGNKGYGSTEHMAAIAEHGPSDFHRRTWLRTAEGEPLLARS
ncbi:ribonuclease HII [Planctomonas psychrotolerans]|uniref:ribonuclease HII n=1 Tax=Planctomonas psychrotolerans TaxID=2528712 RepID=UPI001D0D1498|nr:ribonuclease HII [Planctomonas psychrotolerans]